VRIESAEVDNRSVIVRRVYREGRGSVKIRKGFVEGKGYRVRGVIRVGVP
jgi:hypothetical protein